MLMRRTQLWIVILCMGVPIVWSSDPNAGIGDPNITITYDPWDLNQDGWVNFVDYALYANRAGRPHGSGNPTRSIPYKVLADFCDHWLMHDPNNDVPPLYFFYAIHTHGSEDYLPYTDVTQTQLHAQTADNMIAAVNGIREVLDRYGVKGTWELLEGAARGIPAYQGEEHIFKQLSANGHEIGAHAHQLEDTYDVVAALQDDCGIVPVTTSGFITQISRATPDNVLDALSEAIQVQADLGLSVGTTNLCPGGGRNLVSLACEDQLGVGNDMWSNTGNLMFPWRPDYINTNVCTHNPEGKMVLVDHVSIEWLILPDANGPPDVLDDRHFEQLKRYFDAALQYMQENRPQRVACWGFVTHIVEYAVGSRAVHPPEASALEALDRFLAYVDTYRAQGRVIYATSAEIAALAFPNL